MISAFLYQVAGIDTDLIRHCPKSDRIWAAQLGAWLIISFLLIFMICLQSTSYVPQIETLAPVRVAVATLVASTIFLFDRALYQSDWFFHGYLGNVDSSQERSGYDSWLKAVRVIIRLGLSLFLAFTLSMFLELSVFSGSITDRLQENNRAANAPVIAQIENYRKDLEADLVSQRQRIEATESEVAKATEALRLNVPPIFDARLQELTTQIAGLEEEQMRFSANAGPKEVEISDLKLEVLAETEGIQPDRKHPGRFSGIPTCGPRCRSAKKVMELKEAELSVGSQRQVSTRAEIDRLSQKRDAILAELRDSASRSREALESRRHELIANIEHLRSRLSSAEAVVSTRMQAYQDEVHRALGYVELRSDPLLRLRALQELKADARHGPAFTAYAWALKMFVIFIEIVPVLGKIFFAPPSAYALFLQKKIRDHQRMGVGLAEVFLHPSFKSSRRPVARNISGAKESVRRHLTICG